MISERVTISDVGSLPAVMDCESTRQLLGVGRSTFYELVRQNKLPGAFRLGKLVRVNTAQLLAGLGSIDTPLVRAPYEEVR
jgi:excisionase family DNA binding protein